MKRALLIFLIACATSSSVVIVDAQTVTTPVSQPESSEQQDTTSMNGRDERYRIGLQDILDIQVFRHADLSGRFPVSPNGTILLFRLEKPIVAVCKTETELAMDIENAYKEKYLREPRVKVGVAEQRSQSISVIGAVERPGTYYVNRRVHLLEILAQAGGPNKEAGTRLLVARTGSNSSCKASGTAGENEQIAVVDFKIRDVQEGRQTFWMQPGDVVSILDADVIYVYGNVNKQGSYRVREPITLTQAIVSAEGLKPAAQKDKIRILRQSPGDLERKELVFDLNDIDKGKARDPYLEPNDIVAISQDKARAILNGIARSIKTALPSAAYRIP
ncbi:MAG: SLBB domain-containing protein [Chloracidobacterium sp.]|nr:SLBB domain-containing protein [Chloracidobacterium sp.]